MEAETDTINNEEEDDINSNNKSRGLTTFDSSVAPTSFKPFDVDFDVQSSTGSTSTQNKRFVLFV